MKGWTDQAHPVLHSEIQEWERTHPGERRRRLLREWGTVLGEVAFFALLLLFFLVLLPIVAGPLPW